MAFDFNRWIRQPTTLHGLGVVAGGVGAALAQIATGNATLDAVIAVVAYALVHLGIDDHSAAEVAVRDLTATALAGGQGANAATLLGEATTAASAFAAPSIATNTGASS